VLKRKSREVAAQEVSDETSETSKKRRKHRQWSGTTIGLLAAAAGLVLGRLGYLYPAFDVFAQFGMQFSLMATAFFIAYFIPRYKAILGFALTALFLVIYGAWPHFISHGLPKGPFPVEQGEEIFTAAQFNIHEENADLESVKQEIARLDTDVITLVEFVPSKTPILNDLKQQYPHQAIFHDMGGLNFAILSKLPIVERDGVALWEGPPYAAAKLGGRLNGLWVYAVHTTRFPHSRAQLKQVQGLVRKLQSANGPTLMMGDFNATPFSRLPAILENGLNLRRVTHLPTWPAIPGLPQLAIDHIFLGQELRVVADEQIGNNAGSDHYPITMTLAFKAR
jgi:endonuclease/exonuclease/phosphatase (EEP) superfamily protein YafD